jgi:hypothetical protein
VYVRRVELEDLRCFEGKHAFDLGDDGEYAGWTVFAGRNASGKTSLLRAIGLAAAGLVRATNLNRGAKWTRPGQRMGHATVEIGTDDLRVVTLVGFPDEDRRLADINSVARFLRADERGSALFSVVPGDASPADVQRMSAAEQLAIPLIGYGTSRIAGSRDKDAPPDSLAHLMSGGWELDEGLAWLKDVYTRSLEKSAAHVELMKAVLRLLQDGLLPPGVVVERFDADGLWVTVGDVTQPLRTLSDGYRAVGTLVLDMVRHLHAQTASLRFSEVGGLWVCDAAAIVLIDEVDAHLHVSWQQRIGFWLTRHFPNIQFFVTTHSPFICQAARTNGLFRLPAPDEPGRKIEPVSEDTWRAVVNGGADDAVMSDLFGLDHATSNEAEQRRDEMALLEGRILRKQATKADRDRYAALKAEVGDTLAAAVDRVSRRIAQGETGR